MLDVVRTRLATHRLVPPYFDGPVDAVRALVAVQAQDYGAGLWAIGQRTANPSRAAVEAALADRSLVRTWPMRGTLHIVARDDVRWLLALLAPRVIKRAAGRYRDLSLDERTFAKARTLFEKHLAGTTMTRPELFAILDAAKITSKEQRGIHILGKLAMDGVLCFGAHRGKQPTFALLDDWIPASRAITGDEALGELARRYFTGHGPATVDDFAWWTGLNLTEARRAVEIAGESFEYPTAAKRGTAHLLSAWDEYTVGYRDRSAIVDGKHVKSSLNALAWVVAIDGRIAGLWKRTAKKAGVDVTVAPFGRTPIDPKAQKAIDRAIERFQTFAQS